MQGAAWPCRAGRGVAWGCVAWRRVTSRGVAWQGRPREGVPAVVASLRSDLRLFFFSRDEIKSAGGGRQQHLWQAASALVGRAGAARGGARAGWGS